MIEITDSPLAILAACFLPLLFLSLIIVPILVTRSRLKKFVRIKQNQIQEPNYEFLNYKKLSLPLKIVLIIGLSLAISLFIGIIIAVFWIGKTIGFDNPTYLFGMVAPLVCSIPASAFLLLFIHRRIYKNK